MALAGGPEASSSSRRSAAPIQAGSCESALACTIGTRPSLPRRDAHPEVGDGINSSRSMLDDTSSRRRECAIHHVAMRESDMQTSGKEPIADKIMSARQDLAQALAELERLPVADPDQVWTVVHSMNNYLTVVNAGVGLLKESLREHTNRDVHTWLDGLQHAAVLMQKTVAQLTSGVDETESAYISETVDLTLAVRRVGRYYGSIADKKGICIEVKTGEQPAFAQFDRVALGVVLDNILSNAVKYSPKGSTVHLSLESERPDLVCRVRDEGPGIGKEEQERLFQQGVPLSAQPTGSEASTGYGLAIAKKIMERLGGRIWCESSPGQGATFCVSLPEVAAP